MVLDLALLPGQQVRVGFLFPVFGNPPRWFRVGFLDLGFDVAFVAVRRVFLHTSEEGQQGGWRVLGERIRGPFVCVDWDKDSVW